MGHSVVVLTHDSEKTIRRCLDALLSQTYKDFELIIIDDCSTDKTRDILDSYEDKRIRIFLNQIQFGIAKSRNRGLRESKEKLIFFTDSDCIPSKRWLELGIKSIKNNDIVTGTTFYEKQNPTFKHRVIYSRDHFVTCNLGFKRKEIEEVNGFDEEEFNMYSEDKDLCFRILKNKGKKVFCPEMIVVHQEVFKTPKRELNTYKHYLCNKLKLQVKYGKEQSIFKRIIRPDMLLCTVFPFAILIVEQFKGFRDLKILPFTWLGMLIGRIMMWKKCIELRKFYI